MAWCPNNICCSGGQWIAVTLCWECLFDYFVLVTLYMSLTSFFIIDQSARACTICYFNVSVMCSPIKYDASFSLASFFFFLWSYQRSCNDKSVRQPWVIFFFCLEMLFTHLYIPVLSASLCFEPNVQVLGFLSETFSFIDSLASFSFCKDGLFWFNHFWCFRR